MKVSKRDASRLRGMLHYEFDCHKISFSAAISACEKGQQWQRALQLMEGMQARSVQPNVISYNAAISACGKGQQWQWVLQLMEGMQARNVPVSDTHLRPHAP